MPISNGVITGNAINWLGIKVVASAMRLYLTVGVQANRNYTPARMRKFATGYTGVTYPRSRKGLERAMTELEAWVASRRPDDVERAS